MTDAPDWEIIIDVDELARAEDENWVWSGATVLRPDYERALVSLSRGGADATVIREFDIPPSRQWITDGFNLPEDKSSVRWIDRDTVYVGTDFGEQPDGVGSLTDSGYPPAWSSAGRGAHRSRPPRRSSRARRATCR